jgi:hypothetical protein
MSTKALIRDEVKITECTSPPHLYRLAMAFLLASALNIFLIAVGFLD